MAIMKCKMCGGELTFTPGETVGTCDYCGTKQTLPKSTDENLQSLFNRANVLRMKADFDKAADIYEKILQVSGTEAEAYWGLVLCKYGIEYVEDPTTFKRIPTCHRASFDAVVADDDYKMAVQYADMMQKELYEEQAKQIDEIQKGIIALAQKEAPYDVFICYKETDESGKRTQDSVIANDIYYQLTQEGFKVFYAAITLEDKLGQEYEPYIFSALNSAKVMLALGTKPEYFNAVWVKNEWSRFLKIMKKDRARMLIPCYRDMDAYELPEEFAHLQAQDMNKIGFINDVVRGIKKVIKKDEEQITSVQDALKVQQTVVNSNVQTLLERGNIALEDSEWQKADDFFEEVLNNDAKNAEAYLGKLMAKYEQSNISSLTQYYISTYEDVESKKLEACAEETSRIENAVASYTVLDYLSDTEIKKQYEFDRTYISVLSCRKAQKSRQLDELAGEKLLVRAQQYANEETKTIIDKMFESITSALNERIVAAEQADKESIASVRRSYEIHLNDADLNTKELYNKALERQESTYNSRVNQMNLAQTIDDYEKVQGQFKSMHGYKDTLTLADKCQLEIDRLKEEERRETEKREEIRRKEAERLAKKKKMIGIATIAVIVACIVVFFVVTKVVIPNNRYDKELAACKSAEIGDVIKFGNYKGNTEWQVLAKEDGKLLVISKYVLETKEYNTDATDETWELCSLRNWLNGEFITSAFGSKEKELILSTNIVNSSGKNTTDRVFCLSIGEVNEYFIDDEDRVAIPTEYVKGKLSEYDMEDFMDESSGGGRWWLRSPGLNVETAAYVDGSGWVYGRGLGVNYDAVGIRPALWLNLES